MKTMALTFGIVLIALAAFPVFGAPQGDEVVDLLNRPSPPGEATRVSLGVFLIDISKIDNKNQSFTADFVVQVRWHDPRLIRPGEAGSIAQRSVDLDELWHPQIQILNELGLKRLMNRSFSTPDGTVTHSQRFYGALRAPMDFKDFPWDEQRLVVKVVFIQPASEVEVSLDSEVTGRMPNLSITDWEIGDSSTTVEPWTAGSNRMDLLLCELACVARRHTVFFFIKVILTVTLIFFMAWAVFWIDPSQVAPQIGISTSSVFTLIAFQFTLSYLLPPIPYLTRLDRFTAGVTILVFAALGEAITTTMLALRGRKELSQRIDRWARILFLLAFGLVIFLALA